MRSHDGAKKLFSSEAVALGVIISIAALVPGLYSVSFIAFGFLYAYYGALQLKERGLLSFENLLLLTAAFLLPWCAFELLFGLLFSGTHSQSPYLTVLFFLALSVALPIVVLAAIAFQKGDKAIAKPGPFSPHLVLSEGGLSYLFGGIAVFTLFFPAATVLTFTENTAATAGESRKASLIAQLKNPAYLGDRYHISLRTEVAREVVVSLPSDSEVSKTNLLPYGNEPLWRLVVADDGRLYNHEGKSKSSLSLITTEPGDQTIQKESGYLVKGDDIASFLYTRLSMLGLESKEFTPLVKEWALKLFQYEFVQVSFELTPLVNESILIEPTPESVYELSILFQPRYSRVELKPQELPVVKSSPYTAIVLRARKVSAPDSFAF